MCKCNEGKKMVFAHVAWHRPRCRHNCAAWWPSHLRRLRHNTYHNQQRENQKALNTHGTLLVQRKLYSRAVRPQDGKCIDKIGLWSVRWNAVAAISPPPRKQSEAETTTNCRSKVVVGERGDAGAMRNGDGQT